MGRIGGRQALPIDAGDKPLPLFIAELTHRIARLPRDEITAVQASLAQPDTIAFQANQLYSIAAAVAKYIEGAVAGYASEYLLD